MVTPCCGRSLRTGTIIVASMEIVFSSISALFYVLGLAAVGGSELGLQEIQDIQHNFRIPFVDVENRGSEQIVGALTAIFVVALLSCVLAIAFSTFLLLSLHRKGDERHVKVWLVYKIILLTLALVFIVSVAVSGASTVNSTISDLLSTVMHGYFFWVVYTYRREMCVEKAENTPSSITGIQGNIQVNFEL